MAQMKPPLFDLIVPPEKVHEKFEVIRTAKNAAPARAMLNSIYEDFTDPDGNFVEQFQTTGFDSRYFELYLFAYLSRSGYRIDRSNAFPDFIVERGGATVAIEATTTNPSTSGVLKDAKKIGDLSPSELADYEQNELAIRFGGPLLAKLRKRYWELPHCSGIPLVLAIEAFHDELSLGMTDSSLMRYAYGSTTKADWSDEGELRISSEKVEKHFARGKEIPSHFFSLPDSQNISAIIFTNSGTHPKFTRMGYQHGYETDEIEIVRFGRSFTMDHDAMDSTFFSYRMSEPPYVETWGQGLCVMHNPNAICPLPKDYFVDAVQCHSVSGRLVTEHKGFHPFSSTTASFYLGGYKKEFAKYIPALPPLTEVGPIPREAFRHALQSSGSDYIPSDDEHGWFADVGWGFYGVVLKQEDHWCLQIFARDEYFTFFKCCEGHVPEIRGIAVQELQAKIADLLRSPQRVFPGRKLPANPEPQEDDT